jgi:hypothetical protein
MSTKLAQMGWNPDSPTNELRVSLLAYLREQQHQLLGPPALPGPNIAWWDYDGLAIAARVTNLRRWIAWLEGTEVQISTKETPK